MDRNVLETALLQAHEKHELDELVRLYAIAGDEAEKSQDVDAACFFLTHAFVFALEAGAPQANPLNKRLTDYGRAIRLEF